MNILIFTAKNIGVELVASVVRMFPDDRYAVFVCEPSASDTIDALSKIGIKSRLFDGSALEELLSMESSHFDWLLNLWGGHIFKPDLLKKAKYTLNIHPGLLPFCRGRDPVVWAMRYGRQAGVCLHEITNGVDSGPIYVQEEVSYQLPITGGDLYKMVVQQCPKLLKKYWPEIRAGRLTAVSQKSGNYQTFKRSDLLDQQQLILDGNEDALDLFRWLLSFDFGEQLSAQIVLNSRKYNVKLLLMS